MYLCTVNVWETRTYMSENSKSPRFQSSLISGMLCTWAFKLADEILGLGKAQSTTFQPLHAPGCLLTICAAIQSASASVVSRFLSLLVSLACKYMHMGSSGLWRLFLPTTCSANLRPQAKNCRIGLNILHLGQVKKKWCETRIRPKCLRQLHTIGSLKG